MATSTQVTVTGNLTADPEMRHLPSGDAVAHFTVACSNGSRPSTFIDCQAWRAMAEHILATLRRGTGVIASGELRQRSYDTSDGSTRTVTWLEIDDVGPSLRRATAVVTTSRRAVQDAHGDHPASNDAMESSS
jgi:single-strand DNA-binding protein